MPKMKTHRGAAKRLKKTASGKLKRRRAYSHILTKKSRKRKRRLRKSALVFKGEAKRLNKILAYL